MALAPKPETFPQIRSGLKFYQVTAYITGVMLLLLCAEMIAKYWFGSEIELGGAYGFLALVPDGTVQAVNLSTGILIVHGWFYVIYLIACFRLWTFMRWNLPQLLLMATGGVVPFLSFIVEVRLSRTINSYLTNREAELAEAAH
ncbi:DUF3817 domain-containing protein [Salinibacterium sp. ZJ450]|uniref:DUF3817 domain-containing protein n=1 Tax=Salinibacterium sp. ZJ450 TaxID=2708338 RepID=UPI00141ECB15|nr:DUF3817 domain-containing protein [Salinibacterium sp. ZJ450]